MFLTDDQITDILIDYINTDGYNQAVLIDGEWGTGKSYYIRQKFIPAANNFFNKEKQQHKILYVSLYGISTVEQFTNEIMTCYMEDFLKKRCTDQASEKIAKGLNIVSKVATAALKIFNLDTNDLPSFSDFTSINESVLVVDDLERCSIEINEVLGYINNLVENNSIKVIIVANQNEILGNKINRDLPLKYMVASNLYMKNFFNDNSEKTNGQNDYNEQEQRIDIQTVKDNAKQIFAKDSIYDRIKEKVIFFTINYIPDFNNAYIDIVTKYTESETQRFLLKNKETVVNIFKEQNHSNLRTLVFIVIYFGKIYEPNEIIDSSIETAVSEFYQKEWLDVLVYLTEQVIYLKTYNSILVPKVDSEIFTISFNKKSFSGGITGYKFVNTYLNTFTYDTSKVKDLLLKQAHEKYAEHMEKQAQAVLSIHKLEEWKYMKNGDVYSNLNNCENELKDGKYTPHYFKRIIIVLLQLKHVEFPLIDYEDKLKTFVEYMVKYINDKECELYENDLNYYSWDRDEVEEYNKIMSPLFEIIDQKVINQKENINYVFENDNWGELFNEECIKKERMFNMDGKFLYYIDVDLLINAIKKANPENIYNFIHGINAIYCFQNLNDFFKDDIENIEMLLERLKKIGVENEYYTRKLALESLIKILSEYRDRIQR